MQGNPVNVEKIEFQTDSALVTMRDPSDCDKKVTKRVAVDDLLKALGSITACSRVEVPENCRGIWETRSYKYFLFIVPAHMGISVVAWDSNDSYRFGTPAISTRYDEQDNDTRLMYAGRNGLRFFKTPFPDAAILARFDKIGTQELSFDTMYAWALKSTKFALINTPVYRWPFFNMYNDTRVCIGSIPREYQTVDAIASIVKYLFIGIGNHDLDGTPYIASSCAAGVGNPFEAVKYFHEHNTTSFPQDMLVPYNRSLIDLVESLVSNGR